MSGQPSPPLPNHVVDFMKQMDSKNSPPFFSKNKQAGSFVMHNKKGFCMVRQAGNGNLITGETIVITSQEKTPAANLSIPN